MHHPPPRPPSRLETATALRLQSERWRTAGLSVGMVPTMGALHDGHRSLVRRARRECDRVVVSIFVNPRQFGEGEDLSRYPRPLDRDLALLAAEGVDAVYLPSADVMYPPGFATTVSVTGAVGETLEAAARPGHFDGVAVAVAKLLIAARCDRAYFGQKDAQQCAVVRRLAADLDLGTQIVVCRTVRDTDGLALSSRNAYLDAEERRQALAIPAGIADAARAFATGERSAEALRAAVLKRLAAAPGLRPEYVAVVDGDTFAPLSEAAPGARIQVAARIGDARLIDTHCLGDDEPPAVDGAAGAATVAGPRSGEAERNAPCTVS